MTLGEIFRPRRSEFAPRTMVLGILLGFGAMGWLGRWAAHENYHGDFVRFTPWTAPDTQYYPTINELLTIVRKQATPHQILVIIGGNSILVGVGQPPVHLWTKRLQAELGDGYCVVNFAFRGALPTDGGAVAAEALRQEFPRQIYVANAAPTQEIPAAGSRVYRFMFWDAYYKGLLIDDPIRAAAIKASVTTEGADAAELRELRIREGFDRLFYFQDLWNFVAYTRFSTVWDSYFPGVRGFSAPLQFTEPRKNFPDPEPDYLTVSVSARFPSTRNQFELQTVRDFSRLAYEPEKGPDGQWQPKPAVWDKFRSEIAAAFPPDLKRRTLILTGHPSPNYIQRLTVSERERDAFFYAQAAREWEKDGYAALEFGGDFTIDDYGDRTHLTWHGGNKLAGMVAAKVRALSKDLGYLAP
jgi:hypothetical protein